MKNKSDREQIYPYKKRQTMSKIFSELRLAKALRFHIGPDGSLRASLSHSSGEFFVAPEVLLILQEIAKNKKTVKKLNLPDILSTQLQHTQRTLPSEEECESIIADLMGAGVVLDARQQTNKHLQQDGFGNGWIQWAMLADKPRCEAYAQALEKVVQKNSVVVDVGAGTGLWSALALQLGAKQVIAIEETQMANSIPLILKKLNLPTAAPRFLLHNQNSFDCDLPLATNVVVSELFGNDPFQEGALATLSHVAKRLKSKNVTYLPEKVEIFWECIDVQKNPALARIQQLQKKPGNSFLDQFMRYAKDILDVAQTSFELPLNASDFVRVSDPVSLGALKLNPPESFAKIMKQISGQKNIKLHTEGENLLGILWFRVTVLGSLSVSSHPQEKDASTHWSLVAFVFPYSKGSRSISIDYSLDEADSRMVIRAKCNT